ncbi:MAG: hypothetical protein RIT44_1947, partial [Pseudomonadota bacterium]|jgi:hypothetical protein
VVEKAAAVADSVAELLALTYSKARRCGLFFGFFAGFFVADLFIEVLFIAVF